MFAACFAGCFAAASDASEAASQLARAAAKAERKGDVARAYVLYSHAYALDPANPAYALRIRDFESVAKLDPGLKDKADAIGKEAKPDAGLDDSLFGELTASDAAEARKPLPPTELKATPALRDFDVRGDGKSLFEQVAKAFGLLVVFDSEYSPSPPTRFQMQQVDYRTALRALEDATGTFVIPVGDRLVFVAADTPAKRKEFERTVSVTIPIPETVNTQELQEMVNAVRSTMDIQRVMVDTTNRMVLLRDQISKVRPAQALLESLLRAHPQVDLEVELLDIDDSDSLQWGAGLPSSFPLIDFGTIANYVATTAIPSGFSSFLTFGGGATILGIGIAQANLFATVTKAITSTVYRAHLTASQGQPALLHVGSKYPLISSTFTTSASGTGTAAASYVPPPTIQFQDLGFELKITPHIHGTEEVTLEVEASYTLLGAVQPSGIPAINNRKFQSTVRLHEGEWAVLTGLISRTDAASFSGIAGLANVPVLGRLLGNNTRNTDRAGALLVIKPRLLNLPPTDLPTPALLTGTETKPISLL
ncbi:MAG: type II and III secretion system protein [Bryobacteraceae bacterium]